MSVLLLEFTVTITAEIQKWTSKPNCEKVKKLTVEPTIFIIIIYLQHFLNLYVRLIFSVMTLSVSVKNQSSFTN